MTAVALIFAALCTGIFLLLALAPIILEQPHGKRRPKEHAARVWEDEL